MTILLLTILERSSGNFTANYFGTVLWQCRRGGWRQVGWRHQPLGHRRPGWQVPLINSNNKYHRTGTPHIDTRQCTQWTVQLSSNNSCFERLCERTGQTLRKVDCVKPLVINNELFFIVLPALPVLPAKKYNLFKVFLIISSADFRRRWQIEHHYKKGLVWFGKGKNCRCHLHTRVILPCAKHWSWEVIK